MSFAVWVFTARCVGTAALEVEWKHGWIFITPSSQYDKVICNANNHLVLLLPNSLMWRLGAGFAKVSAGGQWRAARLGSAKGSLISGIVINKTQIASIFFCYKKITLDFYKSLLFMPWEMEKEALIIPYFSYITYINSYHHSKRKM